MSVAAVQAVARQGPATEATMAWFASWHWQLMSMSWQGVAPAALTKHGSYRAC